MKYDIRDLLKQLNDRNPSELSALDSHELRRFEALCESWARFGAAELARRALPRERRLLSPAGSVVTPRAVDSARAQRSVGARMMKRFGKRRAEIMLFLNGLSEHEKLAVFTYLSKDKAIAA